MDPYTNEELADMHLIYGESRGNCRLARRLYQNKFPHRRIPSHPTFAQIDRRLRETGAFKPNRWNAGRRPQVLQPHVEENILDMVEQNPTTSMKRVALRCGVSKTSAWRVCHKQLLHPYHAQKVQELKPADLPKRSEFCRWILQEFRQNPQFLETLLFTDEVCFTKDGVLNLHNLHKWADENPRFIRPTKSQYRFSKNVWAGVIGNVLIGPHVLPPRLTGHTYLEFLRNDLTPLMEEVPLRLRRNMRFMHDGAPPHRYGTVKNYLDATYPGRWIGNGGPVAWPPRSPDINVLDFYLWGAMKDLVYATEIRSQEDLLQRIQDAADANRLIPGVFLRTRGNFLKRCQLCIQENGGHYEHLL